MADQKPPVPAGETGQQPSSPAIVNKTPIKSPREIQLEKKVSVLEDKVGGIEGTLGELNKWLADMLPGGKPPPTPKETSPAPNPQQVPTRKRTFTDEVNDVLGWS